MPCIHTFIERDDKLFIRLEGSSLGMEDIAGLRKEMFKVLNEKKYAEILLDTRQIEIVGSLVISLLVELVKYANESKAQISVIENRRQGLDSFDLSSIDKLIKVIDHLPEESH